MALQMMQEIPLTHSIFLKSINGLKKQLLDHKESNLKPNLSSKSTKKRGHPKGLDPKGLVLS